MGLRFHHGCLAASGFTASFLFAERARDKTNGNPSNKYSPGNVILCLQKAKG